MNIDPLVNLRTFIVDGKKGTIFCERINIARWGHRWGHPTSSSYSAIAIIDFCVQIIVWTNERAYKLWNDIDKRLIEDFGLKEDDYGFLPEHLEAFLNADFHPGLLYIPESVVRQEIDRARTARLDIDSRFLETFSMVQVRLHNMQCTTKHATDLRQSCILLNEWLTEEEETKFVEENEKENLFSFFIFWPKGTK